MVDLFYECGENDIAKYAYDTTPVFVVLTFPLSFLNHRVSESTKVFNWLGNNHRKINPGKCRLLLSTKSPEDVSIDGMQITSSTAETL